MKMKKINILAVSIIVSAFAIMSMSAAPVHAHCPLCTAATVIGLEITRRYGVDDSIVGIWIGAVVISTSLWFDRILRKKYPNAIPMQSIILSLIGLILTAIPFYFAGLFSNPVRIFGMDRLLFGILIGSVLTFGGTELSIWIKNKNGKVFVSYQTIIITIAALTITSGIFWHLIRNTGVLG